MVVVRGDETDVAPFVENPENWEEEPIFSLGNEVGVYTRFLDEHIFKIFVQI